MNRKLIIVLAIPITVALSGCGDVGGEKQTEKKIEKAVNTEVKKAEGTTVAPTEMEEDVKVAEQKSTEDKAAALYSASCASCHGKDGMTAALGASKKIASMSQAEIVGALEGYKNGSYGGKMKNVMKPQADRLSEDDIQRLATYITNLR